MVVKRTGGEEERLIRKKKAVLPRPLKTTKLKLDLERIYEEQDQCHNKGVNRERLDHGETDDQGRRDLSGCAGVSCDTLCGTLKAHSLAYTGSEGRNPDCETAGKRCNSIIFEFCVSGCCHRSGCSLFGKYRRCEQNYQ